MSSRFAYRPLKEPDEIRILFLEPSENRDAALRGSLRHTTLSYKYHDIFEPFVALSYVWGDPTPIDTIILDGCEVGIAANLGTALKNIREDRRTHRIWADALCINQACTDERSAQVSLMGDIYRTAENTIIYLGELTSDVELVFGEVSRRRFRNNQLGYPLQCPHGELRHCFREDCETMNTLSPIKDAALRDLLARPWFRRAWIFQELVLSNDAWVQCGRLRVRWHNLCLLLVPLLETVASKEKKWRHNNNSETTKDLSPLGRANILRHMNDVRETFQNTRHVSHHVNTAYPLRGEDPDSISSLQKLGLEQFLRSNIRDRTSNPWMLDSEALELWRILGRRTGSQVSDPRDMIYAHMGLHSDRSRVEQFIKIDYNKSIREVLTSAGHYCWRHADERDICAAFTQSPLRSILPSWVPDWGIDVPRGRLNDEKLSERDFRASECLLIAKPSKRKDVKFVSDPLPPSEMLYTMLEGQGFWGRDYRGKPYSKIRVQGRNEWNGLMQKLYGEQCTAISSVQLHPIHWVDTMKRNSSSTTGFKLVFEYLVKYMAGDPRFFSHSPPRFALMNNGEITLVDEKVRPGDSTFDPELIDGPSTSYVHLYFRWLQPNMIHEQLDAKLVKMIRDSPRSRAFGVPEHLSIKHCRLVAMTIVPNRSWTIRSTKGVGENTWVAIH